MEVTVGKKSKKKIAVIIVAAIAVVTAGVFAYFLFKPVEVDFAELAAKPVFTGVDGEGKVEAVAIDKDKKEELESSILNKSRAAKVDSFLEDVTFAADGERFSNGDKVKITAKYDALAAEEAGIKVTNDVIVMKVKGLSDRPEDLSLEQICRLGIIETLEQNLRSSETFDYFEMNYFCKSPKGNVIASVVSDGDAYKVYTSNYFTYSAVGIKWDTMEDFIGTSYSSVADARQAIASKGFTLVEIGVAP